MREYKPGGFLSNQLFSYDGIMINYRGPYGTSFRVPKSQIQVVTVDTSSAGKSTLKLIGSGTVLASVTLPTPWAQGAQDWMCAILRGEEDQLDSTIGSLTSSNASLESPSTALDSIMTSLNASSAPVPKKSGCSSGCLIFFVIFFLFWILKAIF